MKLGDFGIDQLYTGDCRVLMKQLPQASVDLAICDPPFGIAFSGRPSNYNRTKERVIAGYNEVSGDYKRFTLSWLLPLCRVLKPTASVYIFSSWNNLRDVLNALAETDLHILNHLIWKYQFGVYTRRRWVTSHYHIIFAVKDPKNYTFNKVADYMEDVLIVKREYWTGKEKTPTKLPLQLVETLLLVSSNPGDIVLDPFMGSGTTAVAAKKHGRHFIGFEIVPDYVKLAQKRLKVVQRALL